MAIVVGQIAPLKMVKDTLINNGIKRFNSIGEINAFQNNYESELKEKYENAKISLDQEIENLKLALIERQRIYEDLKSKIIGELNDKIKILSEELEKEKIRVSKNIFSKLFYFIKLKRIESKKSSIERNLEKYVNNETGGAEFELNNARKKFNHYTENKSNILSLRCMEISKSLSFTKEVVDGLGPLIAGAIGENSVVNEIQKLPDEYYLINDFSVKFNPPIYNKKTNDIIYSVQIDHLLICQSGVYLLETKNWSERSIASLDLRSPVEQIYRTNFALYILLNGGSKFKNVGLDYHHWGSKKVPIKNIIVMTNKKPKGEFKHVKVLSLNELNGYVKYFDPMLSHSEVKNIFEYLNYENNKNAS